MFWEENEIVDESQLNKKLESENVSLQLVLDDIHCFQEIRNNNEKLLAYLTQEAVIKELVETALLPKIDDTMYEKEQYRFSHHCCEAICLSNKEIIKAIVENPSLMKMIVNFLKLHANEINHLVVSFYAKIMVHLLGAETEKVLNMLEESEFLESCMENICYGAIFEVLCGIINCAHDNDLRERVKMWYVSKGFADRLISSLSLEKSTEIHENAGAVWAEFVKSLRDLQYTLELPSDPLLNTLQSRESVQKLLDQMFIADASRRSNSIISNGTIVLNAMLETNFVGNSPSSLITQEAQGGSAASQIMNENPLFVPDPERIVETQCADKVVDFLQAILDAFNRSSEDYSGDILLNCTQLLVNLVNTNHLPTHHKLIVAFKEFPLAKLFDSAIQEPNVSVFNSALSTFVLHILYSHTGEDQSLLNFLFKDFNILRYILSGFKVLFDPARKLDLIRQHSLRALLMNLAERIQHCRHFGHQSDNINQLISENSYFNDWEEFCQTTLVDYLTSNCSETIEPERRSTSERISKVLEIDEVQDMVSSFASPLKPQNLFEDLSRRSNSPTKVLFEQLSSPPEPQKPYTSISTPEQPESPTKALFDQLSTNRANSIESVSPNWPEFASPSLNDDWPTAPTVIVPPVAMDLFNSMPAFDAKVSSIEDEEEFIPARPDMFPVPDDSSSGANKTTENEKFAEFKEISNGLEKMTINEDDDWPTTNVDPFSTPPRNSNKEDSWADFCSPRTKLALDPEEF